MTSSLDGGAASIFGVKAEAATAQKTMNSLTLSYPTTTCHDMIQDRNGERRVTIGIDFNDVKCLGIH
jgi:hypothetical protein